MRRPLHRLIAATVLTFTLATTSCGREADQAAPPPSPTTTSSSVTPPPVPQPTTKHCGNSPPNLCQEWVPLEKRKITEIAALGKQRPGPAGHWGALYLCGMVPDNAVETALGGNIIRTIHLQYCLFEKAGSSARGAGDQRIGYQVKVFFRDGAFDKVCRPGPQQVVDLVATVEEAAGRRMCVLNRPEDGIGEKEVRNDAQIILDIPDVPDQVVVLEAESSGRPANRAATIAANEFSQSVVKLYAAFFLEATAKGS
ncbi:hypothetical protein [Streptoalloteichus hindustanus]|uniref:Uncharacterized protein n=1 Tax=Streptoalloteichus hindustanus TaxID=2017 RepID=A0A1M5NPV4_STRHI|nr:hypothetical protein [Streptoalloteichus hindustanus]SHG91507.1 hypothetical protein SAMN05444320_11667 [Streptoalloteichus hindustanus]